MLFKRFKRYVACVFFVFQSRIKNRLFDFRVNVELVFEFGEEILACLNPTLRGLIDLLEKTGNCLMILF